MRPKASISSQTFLPWAYVLCGEEQFRYFLNLSHMSHLLSEEHEL